MDYLFKIISLLLFIYIIITKYRIKRRKRPVRITTGSPAVLQILVRKSLKMKPGKIAAQVGHAVIGSYKKAEEQGTLEGWENQGEPIVVLKAEDDEIEEVVKKARRVNINVHKVYDAGRTQVKAGSNTVIAVGPGPKNIMKGITGSLKLMN